MRLALPTDWAAGTPDGHGLLPYRLWLRADAVGFATPPRLAGLWPNVAPAMHRRILRARREVDWLPLPGNTLRLAAEQQPVLADGTAVRMLEPGGALHWWQPVADLAFQGREDRVFELDRDAGTLTFGNGETGRIPLPMPGFACRDLCDAAGLAAAWKAADPVSAFVVSLLDQDAAAQLASYALGTVPSRALLQVLLDGLNTALAAEGLYDPARFAGVALGEAARNMLNDIPPGEPANPVLRQRRNRLLLQDAYPRLLAAGTVELRLAVGGGTAGNVGSRRLWEPVASETAPLALNVVPASGGAEPEAIADARQRAAQALRRVERAVLAADFEELAVTTPGVVIRRAHTAPGVHPDFPCLAVPGAVSVFVVPGAARDEDPTVCPEVTAPLPDAGALAAVAARLDGARLIGSEVFVRPPIYRPVALSLDVETHTAAPEALRTALRAGLARFLDPLVGGKEQDGWPWGDPLRPSTLLVWAQQAIGAQGQVARVGITLLDDGTGEESCNDVAIGAHALPALQRVTVRIAAPPASAGGGLT